MNVQVEHLENHTARLTVLIDPEQTTAAKQKAAKRLAKKVRLPGFRPGKAPYTVIARMMGEAAIVEEALEEIGNEFYTKALEESKIEPAAPGQFEEFKEEGGQLKLIFSVPKQPEVDLKDYRSQRFELETEEVTDEAVNKAMQTIQENLAVVEDVEREAQVGDELELDLTVTFWHDDAAHDHDDEDEHDHDHDDDNDDDDDDDDDESDDDDDESDDDDDDDEEESDDDESDEHAHQHAHTLIDDEKYKAVVREAGDSLDAFPGFSAHLVGLKKGDEKVFQLVLPEDFEDETLAGETIDVDLSVKAVRSRTLPAMNDMMAENATNGEVKTLADLQIKVRKDLENAARQMAEEKAFNTAFDAITEQADVRFPEVLVDSAVDDMLESLDQNLQQRANVGLKDYLKMTNLREQDLRAQYRPEAVNRVKRGLIMRQIVESEQLDVDETAINKYLDKATEQFGEQAALYRQLFDSPQNRAGLANEIVTQRAIKRVVDIVTGKEPAIGPDPEESEETSPPAENASVENSESNSEGVS